MSRLPVVVVTGFLGTGKTRYVTQCLHMDDDLWPAVLTWEEGRTPYPDAVRRGQGPALTASMDENAWSAAVQQVQDFVTRTQPGVLYLEWNGMQPFSLLERFLYETELADEWKVEEVVYVTTPTYMQTMFGRTGIANQEQLAAADIIYLEGTSDASSGVVRETRRRLRRLRPDCPIGIGDTLRPQKGAEWWLWMLLLVVALLVGFYVFPPHTSDTFSVLYSAPDRFGNMLSYTVGLFFQAFPFLLGGVFVSAAMQVWVRPRYTDILFRGPIWRRYLFALFGGVGLPLCDCAAIPLFRTLVQQRMPLDLGVTFLLASPLVHPLVLLSTYYAFGGSVAAVLARIGFGLVVAWGVGYSFRNYTKSLVMDTQAQCDAAYLAVYGRPGWRPPTERSLRTVCAHAYSDTITLGRYLLVASAFSAFVQNYLLPLLQEIPGALSTPWALAGMMVLAFLLSLCATADAMIGRALGASLGTAPTLGFLVLGPMMDFKNVLLLQSLFPKRFVATLALRVIVCVYVVVGVGTYLLRPFLNF